MLKINQNYFNIIIINCIVKMSTFSQRYTYRVLQTIQTKLILLCIWAVWQYGLWSFQTGGTKLERFLPMNQHTQRKLLNFENWVDGEVSKIGHHFRK